MIDYKKNPDWHQQADRCGDRTPCIICGRPVTRPRYWLHEHEGGGTIVTQEEAATLDARDRAQGVSSDMGCWPIGSDCLRQHPELRPYVQMGAA